MWFPLRNIAAKSQRERIVLAFLRHKTDGRLENVLGNLSQIICWTEHSLHVQSATLQ